jgi:hypothetical protein
VIRRKFSVPIGINGHERALDQVEKLAHWPRTHNNRFCDRTSAWFDPLTTRHGQMAVSRVKIGNLAAERAGKPLTAMERKQPKSRRGIDERDAVS